MEIAEGNRRSEKIVIDGDGSSSASASGKEEGEIQSDGELFLPRVLACRAAHEANLREEGAENLLDTTIDLLETAENQTDRELIKKMNDMAEQLEAANRRAETAEKHALRVVEVTRERDELKEELEVVREKNERLWERVAVLTQQVEAVSKEQRAVFRVRIDELAHSEHVAEVSGIPSDPLNGIPSKPVRKIYNQLDLAPTRLALPPEKKILQYTEDGETWISIGESQALAGWSELTISSKTLFRRGDYGTPRTLATLMRWNGSNSPFADFPEPSYPRRDTWTSFPETFYPGKVVRKPVLSPPPDKIARMEESGGAESEVADKVAQAMLNLPPRFPVRRQQPSSIGPLDAPPVVDEQIKQLIAEAAAKREKKEKRRQKRLDKFEQEMRRNMSDRVGAPSARTLGILLGRKEPPHKVDEPASSSTVKTLIEMASNLRGSERVRLNSIMNISKFECVCGAKIEDGIALLNHFNDKKHVKKRSQPVYHSDVNYWIETIDDVSREIKRKAILDQKWPRDMYNS